MTLNLQTPSGETLNCEVSHWQDITLDQWKRLTPITDKPSDPLDAMYNAVEVFTGLSQKQLDTMPMKGVGQVHAWIVEQFAEAQKGRDAFRLALEEGNQDYKPEPTITIAGKTFDVPIDVEMETTYGQFRDFENAKAPEHEADLCAQALAYMLVPTGDQYVRTTDADIEFMLQCPMSIAFELSAFFFSKSDQFRHVTNQRSQRFRMYLNALVAKSMRLSTSATEDFLRSLKQPG